MNHKAGHILLAFISIFLFFFVVMCFLLIYQHFSIRHQKRKREAAQRASSAVQDVERDAGMELGVVKVQDRESNSGFAMTPVVHGESGMRGKLEKIPEEDEARNSVDVATRVAALREEVFAVTEEEEPLPELATVYVVGSDDDSDDESDDESDTAKSVVKDGQTGHAVDSSEDSSDDSEDDSGSDTSPAVSSVSSLNDSWSDSLVSPREDIQDVSKSTSIYDSPRYDSDGDSSDGEWDDEKGEREGVEENTEDDPKQSQDEQPVPPYGLSATAH